MGLDDTCKNDSLMQLDLTYINGDAVLHKWVKAQSALRQTCKSNSGIQNSKFKLQGGSKPAAASRPLVELAFGGMLRSDVTCSACGHISTAYDPFMDLSLDILPPEASHSTKPKPKAPPKK